MREGNNPNRELVLPGYSQVIVGAITHLPHEGGYHKDRLEVVKCSLETMRNNAGVKDFQVYIWDNGSCDSFRDWLIEKYKPDYLTLSPNLGKSAARASMVKSLPPKTIVGVADDDIFYYPGWLDAHLKILKHFPRVGQVSGWPVRTQHRFHNIHTLNWARFQKTLTAGRFISEQEEKDFCSSIGRDWAWHKGYTAFDLDYIVKWKGMSAYATAHHCQWVGFADYIAPLLEYSHEAMADERPFEEAVDRAKLLRLTTLKRFTRHIGNKLDDELRRIWLEP